MTYSPRTYLTGLLRCLKTDQGGDYAESVAERILSELTPDQAEDFMGTLKSIASKAPAGAAQVLPGVARGAAAGSALGPYGALIGALAGGVGSAVSGGGRKAPQQPLAGGAPTVPALGSLGALLAALTAGAPSTPPAAASGPAASGVGQVPFAVPPDQAAPPPSISQQSDAQVGANLLRLLQSPQLAQSIVALMAGNAGKTAVPLGGTNIPTEGLLNLLHALSEQALHRLGEANPEADEGTAEYLLDEADEYLCDPSNPLERADVVLSYLTRERSHPSRIGVIDWLAESGFVDAAIDTLPMLVLRRDGREFN